MKLPNNKKGKEIIVGATAYKKGSSMFNLFPKKEALQTAVEKAETLLGYQHFYISSRVEGNSWRLYNVYRKRYTVNIYGPNKYQDSPSGFLEAVRFSLIYWLAKEPNLKEFNLQGSSSLYLSELEGGLKFELLLYNILPASNREGASPFWKVGVLEFDGLEYEAFNFSPGYDLLDNIAPTGSLQAVFRLLMSCLDDYESRRLSIHETKEDSIAPVGDLHLGYYNDYLKRFTNYKFPIEAIGALTAQTTRTRLKTLHALIFQGDKPLAVPLLPPLLSETTVKDPKLAYAFDYLELQGIASYWMSLLRSIKSNIPMIEEGVFISTEGELYRFEGLGKYDVSYDDSSLESEIDLLPCDYEYHPFVKGVGSNPVSHFRIIC